MNHNIPVKKWFSGLHVLRAILVLVIYMSHSASSSFFPKTDTWGIGAVEVFFMLSGFMSAKSFYSSANTARRGLLAECWLSLWKKALSFYPLYLLFQFVGIPTQLRNPAFVSDFVKGLFLTQSYWFNLDTASSFNPPAWFLSTITLSFFLAPVLNRICAKISRYALPALTGIFLMQGAWAFLWRNVTENYGIGQYYIYTFPPVRMLDFIAGIFVFHIYMEREKNPDHGGRQETGIILETGILLFYIGEVTLCRYVPRSFQLTVIWIPVSVMLILLFALEETPVVRWLSGNPFLLWVGELSFELFIVHRLVLAYFAHVDTGLLSWAMAGFSTALISSAAHSLMKIWKSRSQEKKS